MKVKFIIFSLLAALVLAGIVLAATNFDVSTSSVELTERVNSVTFDVTSVGGTTITVPASVDVDDGVGNIVTVSLSPNGPVAIAPGGSETITVSYVSLPEELALGTHEADIDITQGTDTETVVLSLKSEFCDAGCQEKYNDYELTMEIKDIDLEGFGDEKDNEWYPFDQIDIQLELENNGDEDVDDIMIEICLYNEDENDCIIDEDDMEVDDDFKIKDGDDKKLSITYRVDPDDIDEAGDYTLYIKAYSDDADIGEENLCVEDSETITVMEDDFVLLEDIEIPETVDCGETVEITADVWNIGDNEEEDVSIGVYNKELGIDEKVEVGDVGEWDSEPVAFEITIPSDTDAKAFALRITVYDDDGDFFETENEDESVFVYSLKVDGKCIVPTTKKADITATLETERAVAGKEVKIKATVTNTGEENTDYIIGIEGYEFFSTVESITPATLSLDTGESGDVMITLNLNSDASGEQSFYITASFDAEKVRKEARLTVEESGVSITGGAIGESIRDNWFIWIIVIINIILIIAIIIVAARMSRA